MSRINFTKEHLAELQTLAVEFLFKGTSFKGILSTTVTVYELIHNTSIGSLNTLRNSLDQAIKSKEGEDDWSADEASQRALANLKSKRQFIHLLIGYKRYLVEQQTAAEKRVQLQEQISELREQNKTPEERIKELEDQLQNL